MRQAPRSCILDNNKVKINMGSSSCQPLYREWESVWVVPAAHLLQAGAGCSLLTDRTSPRRAAESFR